ncbi:MAG: DNA translocase FtsK, partial [Leptospiraceae bacterium]|nr:DNA translocase FtsK [Leptospiraceae bacterium]
SISGVSGYKLPLSILQFSRRPERNDIAREIEGVKEQLESVMRDYGIQASVVHATRGPMITQYEVRPEPGVRVNRLLRIHDEIRMHLAAHSVRIVAPIPGKSTIGIEIPNSVRETVTLGDLARKDENFFARSRELGIALGKDIAGTNLYLDLAKLPHLLIAGATGSGKSVYMNSVIASILYNRSPEEVRFLMVDPKMVELKLYEGIPHLLYPVITDVRKASRALQWAVQEMERRYTILSRRKVRDIRSFNQKVSEGKIEHDPMPYVVVLIDELSDLMMVSAKDVEDSIIRLTQKARAVGIHLIMATQRPSVDVITALIKANCPARIAFQVAQKTDSRVILDSNGAESLLGRGDMLYKSPSAAGPVRIQSPMVSEEEIEDIVREARKFGSPQFVELPGEDMESEGSMEDVDSELLSEAWKVILESGKTSTSYVQRRLRIGYNRAANLIENLEQMGYLGPAIGNRPREILKRD